jgi:hypothetical protein
VISIFLCGYLLGWVTTTVGLTVIIDKVNDPVQPQRHPVPLIVVAGAAWPLVILGAAQVAALALVVEATRHSTIRSQRSARARLDESLDELLND